MLLFFQLFIFTMIAIIIYDNIRVSPLAPRHERPEAEVRLGRAEDPQVGAARRGEGPLDERALLRELLLVEAVLPWPAGPCPAWASPRWSRRGAWRRDRV